MINLFCGYDPREAIGFHVFASSVLQRASVPIALHPLSAMQHPEGSNTFTFSRFAVPRLMGFQGSAIFADACDMLMLSDIAELAALFDDRYAVQVVKHPAYTSRHARKYIGTEMECDQSNYDRKNWASVMLINCAHEAWQRLDQAGTAALRLLQFQFLRDAEIGELPGDWNRLVDEGQSVRGASLLHWSAGVPAFARYADAPGAEYWHLQRHRMLTH